MKAFKTFHARIKELEVAHTAAEIERSKAPNSAQPGDRDVREAFVALTERQ
jgi:hypothetical protein